MPNNNNEKDVYEEAKRLRRNVATIILIVIMVACAAFAYSQYSNAKENQKRLDDRKAEIKKVKAENKETEKANIKLQKDVGVYDTLSETEQFYDSFYNWSSWKQYRDNMKKLRLLYPQIDDGKVVDISGDKIGASASPTSSYERNTFVGTKKGQTGELVTQTKNYADGTTSEAMFYIISDYDKDELNIKYMKPYRKAQ